MQKDTPLKGILKKLIRDLGKEEINIPAVWEKIVGGKAAKHTKPVFLKEQRLVVNVSDSTWLYKLTLEKEKLIQEFNNNITGNKKIKELQFRIGNTNE